MSPEPIFIREGLAIYLIGTGDPVFVMPGPHRFQRPGLRSADALIEGLTALGRSAITYDPPGSGRSTRSARLGMSEVIDCTDQALAACGVTGPVDALGHSMGGLALLGYALERPQRVRSLILVGTGAGGPAYVGAPASLWAPGHPGFPAVALLGTLHLALRRRATERLLNNHIQRWSFVDHTQATPATIRARDWLRPQEGRAQWHRIARHLDYRPRLHRLTMSTLILCGRHDPQFPPSASRQLAQDIPTTELHWFTDSGHYPFLEEATEFWNAVARFLDTRRDDQSLQQS
jgi:pimeloyl-ACP methyl ester carboxylesterase